jgi:uncharacterized integral membrane protein
MRYRTLFLFLVLALTALFALLNWPAFSTPTSLSLGVGTVYAPLGVIMLGVVVLLGAMCLAYMIYVQGTALFDARRHARELQAHRELADKAESSRFTELHDFIDAEMRQLERLQADSRASMVARIEQMEQRTGVALKETGNSLSAHLGELEDRIDHQRLPDGGRGSVAH